MKANASFDNRSANEINESIDKSSFDEYLLEPNKNLVKPPYSKFNFLVFGCVTACILGAIGTINWLIDPLWYHSGNRLTGRNFPFNERISKTNLFLRSDVKQYDCLIVGSSRVIALHASEFKQHKCFNYAFKGGWAEDFINVAKFVREKGLDPKVVYVGVDEFNFVEKEEVKKENSDFGNYATKTPTEAYLSSNVFLFSIMTLMGVSPDKANYYNENYEIVEFPNASKYKPTFYPAESAQKCDLSRIELYKEIKNAFPNAKVIGFVPPRSPWSLVNQTYNRGIMDCVLEGFHGVSKIYDGMYDFSVPSKITLDSNNTYDGSHFTPQANNEVAAVLEGREGNFGINVSQYSLGGYQQSFKQKLKEFLEGEDKQDLWRG